MISNMKPNAMPSETQVPFDSLQQEAFLNLWRTYDRLKALEEELFGRHELSAQQYNALRLLRMAHPDGLRTLELAARLISKAPDVTRLLDKLSQRGLVKRRRLADNRRVVEVQISARGLKLLDKLDGPVTEMHERQLGHLSAEQLENLVQLLRAARGPHEDNSAAWLEATPCGA